MYRKNILTFSTVLRKNKKKNTFINLTKKKTKKQNKKIQIFKKMINENSLYKD